jgi:hypothetical protein
MVINIEQIIGYNHLAKNHVVQDLVKTVDAALY